jgi:hypothetical protein
VRDDWFLHFTRQSLAEKIVAERLLRNRPPGERKFGGGGTYAISTHYGAYTPGVQHTHVKASASDPLVAVMFQTKAAPKIGFIEEVVWPGDVPLSEVRVISAEEGRRLLKNTPARLKDSDDLVFYSQKKRPAALGAVR